MSHEMIFLAELLVKSVEVGMIQALRENPSDNVTRNAYVDYLYEEGRPNTAELVKEKKLFPIPFAYQAGTLYSGMMYVSQITSGVVTPGAIG